MNFSCYSGFALIELTVVILVTALLVRMIYGKFIVSVFVGMICISGCSFDPSCRDKSKVQMEIIGHRGASEEAPENTVASVQRAWELEADAAEVDVHLSRDGRVMVQHDKATKRQAGVEYVIAETDSSVLRELDMGRFKGESFAGEKMPFLEEVLETIPEGKRLFIEIKCGEDVLPFLERVIQEYGNQKRIVIIGFDLNTVTAMKRRIPQIPVYWLIGRQKSKEQPETNIPLKFEQLEQAKAHNLDGVDVHFSTVTKDVVHQANLMGLDVYAWTVNEAKEAKRLSRCGVKGITTDRPGEFKRLLR